MFVSGFSKISLNAVRESKFARGVCRQPTFLAFAYLVGTRLHY